MDIKTVEIENPQGLNLIFGQSHFIKTVEDLYETLVGSAPSIRFGLAFCESSGPCLVRFAGNDRLFARCIAGRRDFHIDPYGGISF